MPVLDLSFLTDLDRGHAAARALLGAVADDGRPLLVPAPVLLAFLTGCRDPARAAREVAERFEVVPLDVEACVRAAQAARRSRGRTLAEAAAAGVALLRGEPLVTGDPRAFEGVEGLDVLAYRR